MRKIATKLSLVLALSIGIGLSANAAFPTVEQQQSTIAVQANEQTMIAESNTAEAPAVAAATTKAESSKALYGSKSKIVAALLAFFLGNVGVHSFYMGNTMKGLLQLGGTLLGFGLYFAGIVTTVSAIQSGGVVSFPVLSIIGIILIAGVSLWAFIDFVRILIGSLEPEEGFDS